MDSDEGQILTFRTKDRINRDSTVVDCVHFQVFLIVYSFALCFYSKNVAFQVPTYFFYIINNLRVKGLFL